MLNSLKTSRRNFPNFQSLRFYGFYRFPLLLTASLILGGQTAKLSSAEQSDSTAKVLMCGQYQSETSPIVAIASDNEIEIVVTDQTAVSMLSSKTLQKIWSTDLGGVNILSVLLNGNDIYLITQAGRLSREITDGENLPQTVNPETISETPKVNSDILYLRALDRTTGVARWQTEIESSETSSIQKTYLLNRKNFVILISDTGKIFSYSKESGRKIWEKDLAAQLSSAPSMSGDEIVLGTSNRRIFSFSIGDNLLDQVFAVESPPTVIIRDSHGKLIVGDKKGAVSFIESKGKSVNRRFRSGAEISSINETDDGLLVTSLDNFVYLLSKTSGKMIWKKRLAGRVSAAPLIVGGSFIISSIESSDADIFELKTGKFINRISVGKGNFFTARSIRIGSLIFYTTRQGIFSFSIGGNGCLQNKKG